MFLEEFKPVTREFCQQPIAFAGGFVSGVLRLKLTDDPLKKWLQKQGVTDFSGADINQTAQDNRPQSIDID
ncbi:hypothetical protein [Synechocystis sp. PCC 7338]|uniref:hypothetical protein n=1 Tax=Synechocystis sp. PCC 7338 TaxID=2732530 RepID=UPI001BAEDEF8|nr:hypothetical protein [Synechocystis sp. PCC 7338]QUS62292.1 hypothetical protein HTZ78_03935 [Synechocystis sp. PCC 7338]